MTAGIVWRFVRGNPLQVAGTLLFVGLLGKIALVTHQRNELRAEADSLALTVFNEKAERAITENINDTLFARLAVQKELTADALDKLTGIDDPRAEARTVVQVDTVRTERESPVFVGADDVRSTVAEGYSRPYHFHIEVDVPPPPQDSRFAITLGLDPVDLTVRVGCLGTDRIRAAKVSVLAPDWATINLSSVTQDPGVCQLPEPRRDRISKYVWIPLSAVAGAVGTGLTGGDVRLGALIGGAVGITFTLVF